MYDKPIIPGLNVNLYGICIAVGIVICLVLLMVFTKKKGMTTFAQNFFYFTTIVSILIGFVFAALFQSLYTVIRDPKAGFHPFSQGITFLGGLIGGVATFFAVTFGISKLLYKKTPEKYTEICKNFPILFEFAPCGILIAHAFGRIGCFFAGCCYGEVTDSVFGIVFPGLGSDPRHPTQLYEAIFLFAMFAVCTKFFFCDKHYNMAVYLGSYGVWRFLIEFVRGDNAARGKFIGSLYPSQFWSILMVVGAIALVALHFYLKKKKNIDLWV